MEIFSGKAGITAAIQAIGLTPLPPIDIEVVGAVLEAFDILADGNFARLQTWAQAGAFTGLRLGTPCTTYSRARKFDGGPTPLRTDWFLEGVPGLSGRDWDKVWAGTTFMRMSVDLAHMVVQQGGFFTLENPASSMLWLTPEVTDLELRTGAVRVYHDMCQHGSPHKKPTVFLSSHPAFLSLGRRCPGDHYHEPLEGLTTDPDTGKEIFKTKLAQAYPRELCDLYAELAQPLLDKPIGPSSPSDPLLLSYLATTPATERKRALGEPVLREPHRQHGSAVSSVAAGVQMRKDLLSPLVGCQMEPGECLHHVIHMEHPLALPLPLHEAHEALLQMYEHNLPQVSVMRERTSAHWRQRVAALIPD